MKRFAAILVALTAVSCIFTGCEPKKKDIKSKEVTEQNSDSYESAIKECFDAMNSEGGGKAFYSYMYPDAALDAMKQSGEFDELVKTFNDTQAEINKNSNDKYTYAGVKESKELSEKQVSGVKSYFVELSAPYVPDIKEDALDIKEGYEVTYNYKKNDEDAGDETVIVVSLNNEGWKVITR